MHLLSSGMNCRLGQVYNHQTQTHEDKGDTKARRDSWEKKVHEHQKESDARPDREPQATATVSLAHESGDMVLESSATWMMPNASGQLPIVCTGIVCSFFLAAPARSTQLCTLQNTENAASHEDNAHNHLVRERQRSWLCREGQGDGEK